MSTIEGLEAMEGVGNRKNTRVKRNKFTHMSLLTEHRTPEPPERLDKYLRMSLTTYLDLLRMNGCTFY